MYLYCTCVFFRLASSIWRSRQFSIQVAEMQRASRLKRELQMLSTEPPPGITCWQNEDHVDDLRARKYNQQASDCVHPLYEIKYLQFYDWNIKYHLLM